MNDYVFFSIAYMPIIIIGFIVAFLIFFDPKNQDLENKSLKKKIRIFIHSFILSTFISFIAFEIFIYLLFPLSLSVALSGGVAYFGTDKINSIIEKVLKSKFGI